MAGTGGVYCPGPVFRQTAARSALRCARDCTSEAQCVAYSLRPNSQCLLHAEFCESADLLAEERSLYTGCVSFPYNA